MRENVTDNDIVDKTKNRAKENTERKVNYVIVSSNCFTETERERRVNKETEVEVFCFSSSGCMSSQQVLAVASHSMQMGFPPYCLLLYCHIILAEAGAP